MKSYSSIRSTQFVVINAISASQRLQCMVRVVQLTSRSSNFKNGLSKTISCGISTMKKVSSNYRVWQVLSLISKPTITIFFVLICCLLIVAKPHGVSKIFGSNFAEYLREIKLASIPGSIKTGTSSLPLFSLKFQMMHLTVSNSRSRDTFSSSSLLSVIGVETFPMTASFLA